MNSLAHARNGVAVLAATLLAAGPASAVDIAGPVVPVSAEVEANLSFSVTITELIPAAGGGTTIGPVVTSMGFGLLESQGTFDPDGPGPIAPQPRALSSTKAFQVFFGINAQGRPFTIKQTSGPLQVGGSTIPNGAFIVTPLQGVGGDPSRPLPPGTSVGSRGSAVATNKVLFSGSGGRNDTMAATYGITDDPALGATESIPLDQPAGDYSTTITFTATVL